MSSERDPLSPRDRHWRANLWVTAVLSTIWAGASFGVAYWAPELSRINFLGWPLGFYMGAQGSLLVFIALVAVYAKVMAVLDRRLGTEEEPV